MAVVFAKNENRTKVSIYNVTRVLIDVPKTTVVKDGDSIYILNEYKFIPDFELVWCNVMEHYRVYIHMGQGVGDKKKASYTLLVIGSRLAAIGFVGVYQFIFKNRANNKANINPAQGTFAFK